MPYTAVVLDEASRAKILIHVRIPDNFNVIAHHMTVDLQPSAKSMAKDMIGQSVSMLVTTVGTGYNSDGSLSIIALGVVTEAPSKNTRKHITVALDPRFAKPKDSNNINNWTNIAPFTVTGEVQEVK